MDDIREGLLQVSETDKDDTISSETHSLAANELGGVFSGNSYLV
jgi:hypothetical protein